MIIWIASFPKSGNTWMRAFLCAYLYLDLDKETFSFDLLKKIKRFPNQDQLNDIGIKPKSFEDVAKAWIRIQNHINSNKKINFLKTHQAFGNFENISFSNFNNTLGAIHLVRDPRDVLISYSKHMDQTLNETLDLVLEEESKGYLNEKDKDIIGEIRGSWSQHYNSWKNYKTIEVLIIKYEDLISDTQNTFTKIIKYLNKIDNIKIDNEKIKSCVNLTSFKNLRKIEEEKGFIEKGFGKFFFRKGRVGDWKNKLNQNLVKKIEEKFKLEMKELGYID